MKFKTFQGIFIGVAGTLVVVGGLFVATRKGDPPPPPPVAAPRAPPSAVPAPALAVAPIAAPVAAPVAAATSSLPAHEASLVEIMGKPATSDKLKDAVKGKNKVNVYGEGGVWARAKVDFDRDEKWDEKWTFKDGHVEKQVAPADDEAYTEHYVLQGGAWVRKP